MQNRLAPMQVEFVAPGLHFQSGECPLHAGLVATVTILEEMNCWLASNSYRSRLKVRDGRLRLQIGVEASGCPNQWSHWALMHRALTSGEMPKSPRIGFSTFHQSCSTSPWHC